MNNTPSQTPESSCGWRGKILQVDLTGKKIWDEELPEHLINGYIGGAGINARLLYDLLRDNPQADPLSPENPLIFGFGILVGTSFPCASRCTITAKSPLTCIFGDSNGGGWFPARVKQAGYDHIVIRGASEKPVALLIEQGKAPSSLMPMSCGALTPMKQMRVPMRSTARVRRPASDRPARTWSGTPMF